MIFLFRVKRRENFVEALGGHTPSLLAEIGRRVEQRWRYYFLHQRLPDTRYTRLRPPHRAEVALLFLVQEGRDREQRAADAEAGQD